MTKRKLDGLSCMDHLPDRERYNFAGTTCDECGQCIFCRPPSEECWLLHLNVRLPQPPHPLSCLIRPVPPCLVCFQKKKWYDHDDYPFIDREGKKVRQSKVVKARGNGLADEFTVNLRETAPVRSYDDDSTANDKELY